MLFLREGFLSYREVTVSIQARAIESSLRENNLLAWAPLRWLFTSRLYPRTGQLIAALVFGIILLYAFVGHPHGESNLATSLTWRLWWTLLPISFFLVGRAWCGICPLALLSDLVQRVVPWPGRAPGKWLRHNAVLVMGGLFLLLSWAHVWWDIHATPWRTGVVFLLLAGATILVALVYERRAWCRYFCPVGLMGGMYAKLSPVEWRATPTACAACKTQACFAGRDGARGCPVFEYTRAMATNENCVWCGECMSTCPQASPRLSLRSPVAEVSAARAAERGTALFVLALIALVFVEVWRMTPLYPTFMQWAVGLSLVNDYQLLFSLVLAGLIIGMWLVYALAAWLSQRWAGAGQRLRAFVYPYIALALAGHVSLALFELWAEGGRALQITLDQLFIPLTLFPLGPKVRGSIYYSDLTLRTVQFALLGLGLLAAGWVIYRLAQRADKRAWLAAAPHWALTTSIALAFFGLFLWPMKPGC